VVTSMEDMACSGCWESGMSCRVEVHNGTIEGIGVEAGSTLAELLKLKRTIQLRESDIRCPEKGGWQRNYR